jgi:hypothetical protein
VAARFGAAVRAAGLPVGPERCERFAAAVRLAGPVTTGELYWCALATLVSDPAQEPTLARVFRQVFASHDERELAQMLAQRSRPRQLPGPPAATAADPLAGQASAGRDDAPPGPAAAHSYRALATASERLAHRDFADLSDAELAELVAAMRLLRLSPPLRRSRRMRPAAHGGRVDLRATLRLAGRSGGEASRLRRRRPGWRPRRLVVLCDISGSMAPYARAMLQLLYCAAGGTGSEVFTFATRLTRLTRTLRHATPAAALARAGQAAPDWSGGTRIGETLREFNNGHAAAGLARGAVVVIVSDGWDTGDPAQLGRQMARLARLAYRIVWVNPRTASAGYRPLAGGMAAAWPYCDVVVSGHRLAAMPQLLAAISATGDRRAPAGRAWGRPGPGAVTGQTGDGRPATADGGSADA